MHKNYICDVIEILQSYELSTFHWILAFFCAMLIGMSKTGVSGVGLAVLTNIGAIFGGKTSTGLLFPLFVMGGVFAVAYYNRHAEWKYVGRLMPWALGGILAGALVGNYISGKIFNILLSVCILIGVLLMIWKDTRGKNTKLPDYWWFSAVMGLTGGFTTMIGNAAGPVMALYLLSMNLPKNKFIGTAAWFFMIINWVKMPIQVFYWHNVNFHTLLFDALLFPAIVAGAFIGILIVKNIPEKPYRILVISTTVIAATLLFFKKQDKENGRQQKNETSQLLIQQQNR